MLTAQAQCTALIAAELAAKAIIAGIFFIFACTHFTTVEIVNWNKR